MTRQTPLVVVDSADDEPEILVVDTGQDRVTLTTPDGHEFTVDRTELAASLELPEAA